MTDTTLSAAELDELEQAAHLRLLFHAEIAPVFAQARRTEAAERKLAAGIELIDQRVRMLDKQPIDLFELLPLIRRALAED